MVQGVTDRLRPTMGKRKRGGIQGGVVASVIGAMAAATLYLSTNQFNHHMNPVGGTKTPFYDAMIEALSTETDYSLLAHEPVDNNPILYQTLKSFTLSQTHVNKPKADQARFDSAVKFVFSIIIDLLIRLLNPQVWCYSIMLLTLAAVRSMTNTTFWSLLVKCRILYSKKVGEEVARDLGEKVKCKWPSWASKQLAVAVFDNCAYRLRSNHEHVDEARRNRFYETINWFYSFATNVDDDALLAEGQRTTSSTTNTLHSLACYCRILSRSNHLAPQSPLLSLHLPLKVLRYSTTTPRVSIQRWNGMGRQWCQCRRAAPRRRRGRAQRVQGGCLRALHESGVGRGGTGPSRAAIPSGRIHSAAGPDSHAYATSHL